MKFPFTLIPNHTAIDFIGKKKIAFTFSILLTIFICVMFFIKGLNLGIDFTGGIIIEIKPTKPANLHYLREFLYSNGYKGATLQNVGNDNIILIRIQPKKDEDQKQEVDNLKGLLGKYFDQEIEFRKTDYVGPKVGKDLVFNGILATILALICMMLYVWFRFSLQYGFGAIIALFHDMLFTLGFYIITGIDFDITSILAILTVIGYSINDSVVIFDRIRENLRKYKVKDMAELINLSINETLSRTVMTVLTTVVACLALVLFGGEVIYGFSLAMLVGIIFGTYSSIYISAPILIHTNFSKI